jgi:predicted RNase H-like nuclease (RuvC/YqgF family)
MSSSGNWRNNRYVTKDETDVIQGTVQTLQGTVQTLIHDRETDQRTIQSLQGTVQTLQGTVQTLQGEVQTLQGTVQTFTKQTIQEIVKLKKITKPLRKSTRLEDKLLAKQDELIKNNKFEKGKILEKGFAERLKKKYPDRDTTKWEKYVKFTSGGLKNICNPRLSTSSQFFKNPKATPRYIRLFIQRIYNTRK